MSYEDHGIQARRASEWDETASAVFPAQRVLGPCLSTVERTRTRSAERPRPPPVAAGGGARPESRWSLSSTRGKPRA
jgi:hypothetical protein